MYSTAGQTEESAEGLNRSRALHLIVKTDGEHERLAVDGFGVSR